MRRIIQFLILAMMVSVLGGTSATVRGSQTQGEKIFQGTLVKVDADMHVLTAVGTDSAELYFNYSDETKVFGPVKDVQGLTGKPGANLKITYHVEGSSNVATRIEVLP